MKNLFFLILLITIFSNCTVGVKDHKVSDKIVYDEEYTYTDLQKISSDMAESIASSSIVKNNHPVLIIYGITNRTNEHIDTQGLSDSIRTKLFKTNTVKFLSKLQREQISKELEYQYNSGNVNPETRIEKMRQVGADYMLTGRIMSIKKKQPKQFRLRKKRLAYYKLTLEIIDLKTGLIEWTDEVEIVRESKRPLIGW